MCNNKSAYVYAIATDLGGEIHQIFPHKKGCFLQGAAFCLFSALIKLSSSNQHLP